MQAYSDQSRESDPHALPDVEVFYHALGEELPDAEGGSMLPGWYYWFCFPGCMPDGDPIGPFSTQEEALADAQYTYNSQHA